MRHNDRGIGDSIVMTELDLDEEGNVEYIDITISLHKDHFKSGISALYDPIFDSIKDIEGYFKKN
jgi:hypothetical protein